MKYIFTLIILIGFTTIQAQDLAIGQWRSHLSYTVAVSVTQSDEAVYFASEQSLFFINKADNSVELLNKITGLSDSGVQRIHFNKHNDILFIAYTNSNIDLVTKDGAVINVPAIKDGNVIGDKKINHIHFQENFAWLSTSFGIVKFDMQKTEFRFTTFTESIANSVTIYKNKIYASTEDGLFRIDMNTSELSQSNFANWERIGVADGLPSAYYSTVNEVLDDKLYADVNDTLFIYDGNDWSSFYFQENSPFTTLHTGNNRLVVCTDGYDKLLLINPDGTAITFTDRQYVNSLGEAIEDENGVIWIADRFEGVSSFDPTTDDKREYEIDGPYSSKVGEITIHDGEVWVASILLKPSWQKKTLSDGFFHYTNNGWVNYHIKDYPELDNNKYFDILTVAVRPSDKRVFVGSYTGGLIEYDGTNFELYNNGNSILQTQVGDSFDTRIGGLTFDNSNTLWISNHGSVAPIVALEADGTWHSFSPSLSYRFTTQVVVDFNGYKWFASGQSPDGILVFDDGGTLQDTSDDRYFNLTQNNSELESDRIECLTVDLDGNVWAGTENGVVVFECTGQVFSESRCAGRKPIFDENNQDEYLFKDIRVTTIAIDGANRKWMGTNAGLFLLDEDVEETIAAFNTENSPIFSNEIVDVAIDSKSGEVYVGTSEGILSYRGEATEGRDFFKDVYAYPNPVRPEYRGKIAIKGLVTDANVKITDVGGALVYETTALGGQAIWDGNDYNERRAASGVYLVYMTSKDGLEKMVTKILLIN